ncbi:hypothetical protein BI347_15790 [Chromobacterium sphagni]|uniref:Conjugal transfer protein TrbC n=1 Tax=Chromobacterium sphagni TaxID=1903179 RepID=A0A1S1X5P2_9NEIS|nr:hypothetical protein [Chromobacterium sphagni]OHX14804.1 hypothetical protein BI347_15790 [Chromobacterium sphagni]
MLKFKKGNLLLMVAVLALLATETSLADTVATTAGSSGKSLMDTAKQTKDLITSFKEVIGMGLQLVGVMCMGFSGWNIYVSGKPGREDRGHMKTALFAGLGGVIAYFAPDWIGMGGHTLM